MVVQSSIFTGKVHVGEISYKLSCGPVAEGFRRRTLASKFGTSPSKRGERKAAPSEQPHILGRLGSAALVGSQSRRRTTPIRNPQMPDVLDSLDV